MQNLIKMLEIALDLNARLETLDSHIPPLSSTQKVHQTTPSQVFIVAYIADFIKQFSLLLSNEKLPCLKQRITLTVGKNLCSLKQRKGAIISFPEIDKKIDFIT